MHTAFGPADQASGSGSGSARSTVPLPPGLLVAPAQGQGLTRRFAGAGRGEGEWKFGRCVQVSDDATCSGYHIQVPSRTVVSAPATAIVIFRSSDLPNLGMPDLLLISRSSHTIMSPRIGVLGPLKLTICEVTENSEEKETFFPFEKKHHQLNRIQMA